MQKKDILKIVDEKLERIYKEKKQNRKQDFFYSLIDYLQNLINKGIISKYTTFPSPHYEGLEPYDFGNTLLNYIISKDITDNKKYWDPQNIILDEKMALYLIKFIIRNNYDINYKSKKTAASLTHTAAKYHQYALLDKFIDMNNFNPNVTYKIVKYNVLETLVYYFNYHQRFFKNGINTLLKLIQHPKLNINHINKGDNLRTTEFILKWARGGYYKTRYVNELVDMVKKVVMMDKFKINYQDKLGNTIFHHASNYELGNFITDMVTNINNEESKCLLADRLYTSHQRFIKLSDLVSVKHPDLNIKNNKKLDVCESLCHQLIRLIDSRDKTDKYLIPSLYQALCTVIKDPRYVVKDMTIINKLMQKVWVEQLENVDLNNLIEVLRCKVLNDNDYFIIGNFEHLIEERKQYSDESKEEDWEKIKR